MNNKHLGKCASALLVMLVGVSCGAGAAPATAASRIPDSYARPARLVTIAPGRQLNLRCTGSGPQTVMLEAGSHADSTTWFKVQPMLARFARVCAYDRAGFGFSSEGPLPRNLDADTSDLHELIHDAGIATPLVLVGHSLGSNIARRYAERYPADVSGLVLVDPPAQNIAAFAPGWMKDQSEMNAQRFAFIRQCETGAEKHELASPPPALKAWVAKSNPMASAKVNAAMFAYKSKASFWRTLLSELQNNAVIFNQPVSPTEMHGSLPLIVLTAANTYADAPANVRQELEAARETTQTRIITTSSRGERIFVDDTSHDIQLDRPGVVVNATRKVLRET